MNDNNSDDEQKQRAAARLPTDLTLNELGEGVAISGDDVDLEEGKMPAVNNNREEEVHHQDNRSFQQEGKGISSQEGKVLDGDGVQATPVIDVDDIVERRPPANELNNNNRSLEVVERREQESTGHVEDDLMNEKHRAAGRARLPDMDDACPKENYRPSTRDSTSSPRPLGAAVGSSRRSMNSDQVSDWMSTIPEPVSLRNAPRQQMAPGAFAVTPPSASTDVDDEATVGTVQILSQEASTGQVAAQERVAPPPPQPDMMDSGDMLVQATLVEDGDAVDPSMLANFDRYSDNGSSDREVPTNNNNNIALVEAKPLDGYQRTFGEAIRSKWTQLNILIVIGLVSIAVVLGVLAVSNNNGEEPPTLAPSTLAARVTEATASPTFPQTPPPTTPEPTTTTPEPTVSPTSSPTMAPLTRDDLYSFLPEYTQDAMKWKESPQFHAFEWLWGDPNLMTYSLDRMIQRFALLTLLKSVNMDESLMDKAMMYGIHECAWNTLSLKCEDGNNLSGIHLGGVNLQGTLPLELGLLTSLQEIDMSENALSKTIPTTIGQISGLQLLNFGINALSGTLPGSLSSMIELRGLILNDNMLMSTLPAELGWLTHLQQLWLSSNGFQGPIPGSLRHLTGLETLALDNNALSGALPSTLSELTSAREVALNSNNFRGSLPESFGDLTSLVVLDLANNYLSGTVPHTLKNMFNLTRLELQGNNFDGMLPVEICALKEWHDLSEIKVDCSELQCYCFCVCFEDEPTQPNETFGS